MQLAEHQQLHMDSLQTQDAWPDAADADLMLWVELMLVFPLILHANQQTNLAFWLAWLRTHS